MEKESKKRTLQYEEFINMDKDILIAHFKEVVDEFVKTEGVLPSEINLVAEGYSQKSFGKYSVSRRLFQIL